MRGGTSGGRSARAMRVCAMFGLREPAGGPPAWCAGGAAALDGALRAGGIALVCGPSGAGKSALLRALTRRVRRRGGRVVAARAVARPRRRVIDLFACGLGRAVSLLARAGLAEAPLLLRRACDLSEGQRARLGIALAMARAGPGCTLILDEFGSTLDRPTALALAATLRRWVGAGWRVRVVCATAHEDVLEALAPDVLVEQGLGRPAVVTTREAA